MTDIVCRLCREPWSCTGGLHATHTDMPWHHFENFIHGAGCPCCQGEPERQYTPEQQLDLDRAWANSLYAATDETEPYPCFPVIWEKAKAWPWYREELSIIEVMNGKLPRITNEQLAADIRQLLALPNKDTVYIDDELDDDDLTIYARMASHLDFDDSLVGRANREALDCWIGGQHKSVDRWVDYDHNEERGVVVEVGEYNRRTGEIVLDPNHIRLVAVLYAELPRDGQDVWDEDILADLSEKDRQEKMDDFISLELKEELGKFGVLCEVSAHEADQLVDWLDDDPCTVNDFEERALRLVEPMGWSFLRDEGTYLAVPAGLPESDTRSGILINDLMPAQWVDGVPAHEFTRTTTTTYGVIDNGVGWIGLPHWVRVQFHNFCKDN